MRRIPGFQESRAGLPVLLPSAERAIVAGATVALLIVALGGVLVWRTMARQQRVADASLRDHAGYLAESHASSVQTQTFTLVRSLLRGAQWAAAAPARHSAEELTRAQMREALVPGDSTIRPVGYFTFDGVRAERTTTPVGPAPVVAAAMAARLAIPAPPGSTYFGAVVQHGADTTVAFVERARDGNGWVGVELRLDDYRARTILPTLHMHRSTLARALGVPADSTLAAASVRMQDDMLLLAGSPPPSEAAWSASRPIGGPLRAELVWTLHPAAVPALIPGGYPPTPGPRVALLTLLVGTLVTGSAWLAWRAVGMARLKEDFTHAVSHELRTPLANILLYAETLLLERVTEPAARREALATITRETRHLVALVENILATARIGRGDATLAPRPESLDCLVCEVVATFAAAARMRQVTIGVQVEGPDAARVDPEAVRRILVNLLDNALRHAPAGSAITVWARHAPPTVRLGVQDAGPGIPPAMRARVWAPYARGPGGGTGLGLAVVRALARQHGGDAVLGPAAVGTEVLVTLDTTVEGR